MDPLSQPSVSGYGTHVCAGLAEARSHCTGKIKGRQCQWGREWIPLPNLNDISPAPPGEVITGFLQHPAIFSREANRLAIFANRTTLELGHLFQELAAMPTRNVNLTQELDRFVAAQVKSGRYDNASEVVRAALRVLNREEQEHEAKLAALRTAIDEGDASGVAKGNVFARVRKTLHLPAEKA
jgi:antitoxin ParD1/3/4